MGISLPKIAVSLLARMAVINGNSPANNKKDKIHRPRVHAGLDKACAEQRVRRGDGGE